MNFTNIIFNIAKNFLTESYNFSYHLGTAAFGSVIISTFQIIRSILNSIFNQIVELNSDTSTTICFSCCCGSFANAIMYLSRSGYVMCAIHGTDFYTSGKDAFNLIKRSVSKVVVITQVSRHIEKY